MSVAGSLQIILECDADGKFTTSIIRAGTALDDLTSKAKVTVNAVQQVESKVSSSTASFVGWTMAIGESKAALENLYDVFGKWIERIVEVNSHIEQTTALLAGFSDASTQIERLKEGVSQVNTIMTMATQTPFSFGALQDTFVKLKTAAIDPLNGSMKSLTDAVAAFGGDDSRLKRAGYAIQEMAGRGVISLQNLRRQLGQDIPGAVQAMAQAMEMTVEQLDAAVTKGTLNSINAIKLMTDEFDRLYGGAGILRMQTFKGEVAALTTEMMRLAQVAGGTQEGADPRQSSYKAMLEGMNSLNKMMASPEMTAVAVSVNTSLKSLADNVAKLIPYLPTLAQNIGYVGTAFEILVAVLLGKGLIALVSRLGSVFTVVAGNAVTLVGVLGRLPILLETMFDLVAVAGATFVSLGQYSLVAATGIDAVAAASTGVLGAMAGFLALAAEVAVPAALAAGLAYLAYQYLQVKGSAALAGEAMKRLAEGDYTKGNQAAAKEELKLLAEKRTLLQEQLVILENIRTHSGGANRNQLNGVGGALGHDSIDLKNDISFRDESGSKYDEARNAKFKAEADKLKEFDSFLAAEEAVHQAQLLAAPALLMKKLAEQYDVAVQTNLADSEQKISSQYKASMEGIKQRREKAAENPSDQETIKGVNSDYYNVVSDQYEARYTIIRELIGKENDMIATATKAGDTIVAGMHQLEVQKLEDNLAKEIEKGQRALADLGKKGENSSNKDFATQMKEALNAARSMEAATAGLVARLHEGGSEAAKMKSQLSSTGKFNQIGGESSPVGQTLIADATEKDAATESIKKFNAALKESDGLVTGYDKIEAQLHGLVLGLENPGIAEAQRSFVIEQDHMTRSLNTLLQNLDINGLGFDLWAAKVLAATVTTRTAIANAFISSSIVEANRNNAAAESAYIASLPAKERAIAEHNKQMKKLAADKLNVSRSLSLTDDAGVISGINIELANIDQREKNLNATEANRKNKADASANRPGLDALTQMAGRVAELREQIVGGDSELAKWNAKILASPEKYASAAAGIRAYAVEIDDLTKKHKKWEEAQGAIKKLQDSGAKNKAEGEIEGEYLTRGKMLPIEREILKFRKEQAGELEKAKNSPNSAIDDPKAQGLANEAVTQFQKNKLRELVNANEGARLQIEEGFADTTAKRRAAGEQQIAFEQGTLAQLSSVFEAGSADRILIENKTAAYILAKREELARKTEDGLQKLARDWSDISTQMTSFMAQGMSKFIDDLTEKLTTGKAKWSDFADWAIKALIKIQLQAALAPAASGLSSLGSGLASTVGGWLGGAAGASGMNGSTQQAGGQGSAAGGYHTGGIAGSEPTFSRFISGSLFSDAPKFHTGGIAGDETPAILRKGEGVFTEGQMSAIGSLNHSYSFVEQALQALLGVAQQVSSIPQSAVPAVSSGNVGGSGGNGSGMPVTLNVTNQSNQPISAVAGTPKFDGQQMIIEVVIRNLQVPGPLRDAVKGIN